MEPTVLLSLQVELRVGAGRAMSLRDEISLTASEEEQELQDELEEELEQSPPASQTTRGLPAAYGRDLNADPDVVRFDRNRVMRKGVKMREKSKGNRYSFAALLINRAYTRLARQSSTLHYFHEFLPFNPGLQAGASIDAPELRSRCRRAPDRGPQAAAEPEEGPRPAPAVSGAAPGAAPGRRRKWGGGSASFHFVFNFIEISLAFTLLFWTFVFVADLFVVLLSVRILR